MKTPMSDFIESADVPCVAETQTMGTIMVPRHVSLDRIIIEPRDNPHLGDFRLLITVDGSLVYSGETPRGRYTVDIDDIQSKDGPRQIMVVILPAEVPVSIRSYLRNENVRVTVIGKYHESTPTIEVVTEPPAIVDHDWLVPDFTDEFMERWS